MSVNWTVHRYRGKLCDCADCRSVVASLTPRTRARIHVHPTEHRDADPEPGPFDALATCLAHRSTMFLTWDGTNEPHCDACEEDAAMAFRQRRAHAAHAGVLSRQAARRRWLRWMPH